MLARPALQPPAGHASPPQRSDVRRAACSRSDRGSHPAPTARSRHAVHIVLRQSLPERAANSPSRRPISTTQRRRTSTAAAVCTIDGIEAAASELQQRNRNPPLHPTVCAAPAYWQAAMFDDDALWRSGRARGVDDVGRVARVEVRAAARCRAGVRWPASRRRAARCGAAPIGSRRQPVEQRRLRHQHRRSRRRPA